MRVAPIQHLKSREVHNGTEGSTSQQPGYVRWHRNVTLKELDPAERVS
jgi:hypothetical protein